MARKQKGDVKTPRQLPPDTAVVIRPDLSNIPLVLRHQGSIKTLSLAFLADLENDWRIEGPEAIRKMRISSPVAYVQCVASLARVMRVEVGGAGEFDRPRDPREVMDKLEQRVGPQGRALFEEFLRKVNSLQDPEQIDGETVDGDR